MRGKSPRKPAKRAPKRKSRRKRSALVDTRVIYCGDNLEQLKKLPPFEFENWAVIALGGIPNVTQTGDKGIDGRIFPASSMPKRRRKAQQELSFMDDWYPVQVKQKDRAGRPDIDAFETAMQRAERKKGFYVSFGYSKDALVEIDRFFRKTGGMILPLTVKDILEEQLARKLA